MKRHLERIRDGESAALPHGHKRPSIYALRSFFPLLHSTMDESTKVLGSTALNPTQMAEAKAKALRSFERDLSTQNANIKVLPPEPATDSEGAFPEDINSMEDQLHNASKRSLWPRHPPPTTLPCANVQLSKYKVCKDSGTMACSECKLVSYCSKVSNK